MLLMLIGKSTKDNSERKNANSLFIAQPYEAGESIYSVNVVGHWSLILTHLQLTKHAKQNQIKKISTEKKIKKFWG